MLKKTITYTNFNGETIKEDFYFHMTQQELVELEMSEAEGFSALVQRIIDTADSRKLIAEFKKLIDLSYGVKSADGRTFTKGDANLADFKATEAYSQLYMSMLTDTAEAESFFKGIMPAGLVPGPMAPGPKPTTPTLPPPAV